MDATYISFAVGCLFFGFILGVYIFKRKKRKKPDGVFYVNLSDPKKDTFRMDFWIDLNTVVDRNDLYFLVKKEDKSQEKQRL